MGRNTVWVALVALLATCASAQSGGARKGPRRSAPAPSGPALPSMSGPSRVTGEGTTTPSGLTYWDIKIGYGPIVAQGRPVKIHYTGWLEGSNKKFDSSVDVGRPVIFLAGAGQAIKGWEEGVLGMKVGGKRQLRIPPQLAYGPRGSETVPPNSTLICDIEVLGIQ
jgi:peptidylprolyl isomerase